MTCYDLAAWKTNDKAWLKARKAAWKEVKKSLAHIEDVRKPEIPMIKSFFLTGTVDESDILNSYGVRRKEMDEDHPFEGMYSGVLLELWLTADRREENLKDIVAKYNNQKRLDSSFSMREMLKYYPKEGSVLSGLEQEICQYLRPTRLHREDYPNDISYLSVATAIYSVVISSIIDILESPSPNPYNFGRFCLDDMKVAILPAWQKDSELVMCGIKGFASVASQILQSPEKFDELVVEVTKQVLNLLKDPALPAPILEVLSDISSGSDVK